MAYNTNNEELRRQALSTLQEAREEINVELHHFRQQLSLGRVLQRMVNRHTGMVVLAALTVGIVPVWLIFRGRRTLHVEHHQLPPRPVLGTVMLSALGALTKSVTPMLLKSAVIPHVIDFLSRKLTGAVPGKPPV